MKIMKIIQGMAMLYLIMSSELALASGAWQRGKSVQLEPGFTTVFRWDNTSFGVLNPATGVVTLVGTQGEAVRRLQLEGPASRSGSVFPDQIFRDRDGAIHWLSRSKSTIQVHESNGKHRRTIPTHIDSPFWFQRAADGSYFVYGTARHAPIAHIYRLTSDGALLAKVPGVLAAGEAYNHFAWQFFFGASIEPEVTVLAHFPVAVRGTRRIDLSTCGVLKPEVSQAFHDLKDSLPAPMGSTVYDGPGAHYPVVLAATRTADGDVLLTMNGSVIYRLPENGQPTCWSYHFSVESGTYFLSSIAAVDSQVGVLVTKSNGEAVLELWSMGSE